VHLEKPHLQYNYWLQSISASKLGIFKYCSLAGTVNKPLGKKQSTNTMESIRQLLLPSIKKFPSLYWQSWRRMGEHQGCLHCSLHHCQMSPTEWSLLLHSQLMVDLCSLLLTYQLCPPILVPSSPAINWLRLGSATTIVGNRGSDQSSQTMWWKLIGNLRNVVTKSCPNTSHNQQCCWKVPPSIKQNNQSK
jgi:hypothetical protein